MVNIFGPIFEPSFGKHPPPPPLPKYDPREEAPKWDWYRLWYTFPKPERRPDIPRAGGVPDSDDKPDWRGVIKNNIQPLERVEPYDFGAPQQRHYFWFDTPDYADPFKKLWFSFKFFTKTGALLAAVMGHHYGYDLSYKSTRILFTRHFFPWLTGGMLFSVSAIMVANLRGNKDDMTNYLAAGIITGLYKGRYNYIKHVHHTLFWTISGVAMKYIAETNSVLLIRLQPSNHNWGISGMSAEGGIETGNLQFIKATQGDVGRGVRTFA